MLEFTSSEEMIAHYKAVRARTRDYVPPPKPAPVPAPVVVAPPAPPPKPQYEPRWRWISHRWIEKDKDLPEPPENPRIIIADVLRAVSKYYGVSEIELRSKRRTKVIAHQRQIVMYLAKTTTLKSLPDIGRALGGRDHTTILYGVRRIAALVEDDPKLAAEIAEIKAIIGR